MRDETKRIKIPNEEWLGFNNDSMVMNEDVPYLPDTIVRPHKPLLACDISGLKITQLDDSDDELDEIEHFTDSNVSQRYSNLQDD